MTKYPSGVVEIKGIETYYDGYLRSNFELMKKQARMSFDNVIILDGMEGLGKTTFGIEACWYLSGGKFTINDIVFTPKQFFERIKTAKPESAILFDEFIMSGLSTEAFNRVQTEIIKMLTVIRKRRLYIILVIPYFFMLRKYFALARSKCLIHIFSPNGMTRGFFKFYNYSQKKRLFLKGKTDYQYTSVDPSFYGRFYDSAWNIISEKEYDDKKEEAISMIGMSDSALTKMAKLQERMNFFKYIMLNEHKLFTRITQQRNRGYEIMFGQTTANFSPARIEGLKKWFDIKLQENIETHIESKYKVVKGQSKAQQRDAPKFQDWSTEYYEKVMNEVLGIEEEKEEVIKEKKEGESLEG